MEEMPGDSKGDMFKVFARQPGCPLTSLIMHCRGVTCKSQCRVLLPGACGCDDQVHKRLGSVQVKVKNPVSIRADITQPATLPV